MFKKWTLFLVTILLLSACASSSIKTGWIGSDSDGRMNYRYSLFKGVEEKAINLQADKPFSLSYDVAVEDGSLTMKLEDPDGTAVWSETFTADASDSYTMQVEQDGRYRFSVEGEDAGGHFDIQWEQ